MPLFDWASSTSSHISTTPHFWIFWAITIPLTLIVLALWAFWIKIVVPRQQLQDEETLETWKDEVKKDEVKQD
jgi:flagellar biosynthesis/type III secretory pathway M-ring protein FliF/YscJ